MLLLLNWDTDGSQREKDRVVRSCMLMSKNFWNMGVKVKVTWKKMVQELGHFCRINVI